jgi:hypothetical protein
MGPCLFGVRLPGRCRRNACRRPACRRTQAHHGQVGPAAAAQPQQLRWPCRHADQHLVLPLPSATRRLPIVSPPCPGQVADRCGAPRQQRLAKAAAGNVPGREAAVAGPRQQRAAIAGPQQGGDAAGWGVTLGQAGCQAARLVVVQPHHAIRTACCQHRAPAVEGQAAGRHILQKLLYPLRQPQQILQSCDWAAKVTWLRRQHHAGVAWGRPQNSGLGVLAAGQDECTGIGRKVQRTHHYIQFTDSVSEGRTPQGSLEARNGDQNGQPQCRLTTIPISWMLKAA